MPVILEMPNGDRLRFPDDTPDQVIQQAGDRYMKELPGQMALEGMSGFEKFAAGAGQRLSNWGRGLGQYVGATSQQDVDEAKTRDAALMSTTPAKAGDAAMTMATGLATLPIPGANTVAGGALIGGLMGAAEQTGTGDSTLANIGMGTALGGVGQYGANKLAAGMGRRFGQKIIEGADQRALNAPKDSALQAGRELGYVINPAAASKPGIAARQMQGLAGKHALDQNVSLRNQAVTNQAVREELGMAPTARLTENALEAVRRSAWKEGYEPVKMLGKINWSPTYKAELKALSRGTPGSLLDNASAANIEKLVEKIDFKQISGRQALSTLRDLRHTANALFKQYGRNADQSTQAMAHAHWKAADALEDLIEENAFHKGRDTIIPGLRAARARIAKSYDVEHALTEASENVSAKKLARTFEKAPKRMSGNLEKIARFAGNFPDAVKPVENIGASVNPTRVDTHMSLLMGGIGAGGLGPAGIAAGALPQISRNVALRGALSPAVQRSIANPKYGPGLLSTAGFKYGRPLLRGAAPGAGYAAGVGLLPYAVQQ